MNGGLAILVKTPGRSPVKSRLAAGRGAPYAIEWYRHAAAAVASVAKQAQIDFGITAYWAVAEHEALQDWPGLPAIAQGEGGLGARMAQVHAQLVARHGFGILLGADTPQLTAASLGETASWLSRPSPCLALGPARDGGFWLFGGNVAPALGAWTGVAYSTADTARDLQRSMRGTGDWHLLPTLSDTDDATDLDRVQRALQALEAPTAEQRALARWMRAQEKTASAISS